MSIRPVKSWAYPGALLDALRATRNAAAAVEFPFDSEYGEKGRELIHNITEQLDQHLIPRVVEKSSPAIVVVSGSTGSGKSSIVNALLGEQLTASGVLRPTTMAPHLFHHPLDSELLSSASRKAEVLASDAIPRGLAVVDSPDIDSLVGANREVARELLDAADLWVFVTTAARYGDAVPWDVLRAGADRGASIAVVLNRVTVDVAAHVRRDLVDRLRREGLDSLPLFVIPEEPEGLDQLPADVVKGLGRWLDGVASANATSIIERTMEGATEALKEWLEKLAGLMDTQAEAVKQARGDVRRAAARAEQEGGEYWFREIAAGPVSTRWAQTAGSGGPLFKIRGSAWAKRRTAREDRDKALDEIRAELFEAVTGTLAYTAGQASERMTDALGRTDDGPGVWMLAQRDPADAQGVRERHARDAAIGWFTVCERTATGLPNVPAAIELVGEQGLATTFASAVLGIPPARQALALMVGSGLQETFDNMRLQLGAARRYCINREALDTIRPTDLAGLIPEASAEIRLRRAELRGLL